MVAKLGLAKLGVFERQLGDSLNRDQVGSGWLTLVKALDFMLLVDHLVLLGQLIEVVKSCVLFGIAIRSSNACVT